MPEPLLRPSDGGSVAREDWGEESGVGQLNLGIQEGSSAQAPNFCNQKSAYVGPAKLGLSKTGVRLWYKGISRDPGIRTVPETPSARRPQGT